MKRELSHWSFRRDVFTLPWTLLLLTIFLGCQPSAKQSAEDSDFDPNRDYFPHKVEVKHSVGFDVAYHHSHKILSLFRHYNDEVDTIKYLLLQQGAPEPQLNEEMRVINIPVEKVVSVSTTHLGMFDLLDAYEQLKGVEVARYVSNQKIHELVESGSISEVAPAGTLNVESVIDIGTDVLMGVGYPNSQNEAYQQLERAGVPVLLNADWQETNLMGRAEWVKLLAVLLNKEERVNEVFSRIEREYQEVLDLVESKVESGPLTITGIAQGDAWHVAGGESFAYNTMRIARAEYPWSDTKETGSVKLDFETVYEVGLKADFWIGPSHARSLDEILQRDSRYADFKAFKEKRIYNIYGRYTEGGGNDYYEMGVMEPQVILKDVVKIFHPDLLPDHDLVYYAQLQ